MDGELRATRTICKWCKEDSGRLILLGFLEAFGARIHPSPYKCSGGKYHEFIEVEKE